MVFDNISYFISRIFLILPAFVLIERPQITYLQSIASVRKIINNNKKTLILITFVAVAIFMLVQVSISWVLTGAIYYKIIVSDGRDASTGLMIAAQCFYEFITMYLGVIIYTRLSLVLYSKFKAHKDYDKEIKNYAYPRCNNADVIS